MKYLLTISLLIISLSTNAEIITDGTLGQNINLSGPDFQIEANLGQQHGGNLFHSFQDFNLNSSESATFSGPNNVQNILSRVTGGNPSNIDGLLRSTIPNADMYFLNPYGIMFGPNAQLDIQGSFHASTADYLKLGENGRFDVRNPNDSLLTVAPVESFGFLTDSAASISVTDSSLQVLPTKALSLTSGDINLINTESTIYDETSHHIFSNQLTAPSGQIILDAQSTINLTNFGIDTSGPFGGLINISGKKLEMNDSRISSHTIGEFDGLGINVQVDNLLMQDSDIVANTYGAGRGSEINLHINEDLIATRLDRSIGIEFDFSIRGSSHINTITVGEGDLGASGDINVQAGNIILHHSADIGSSSFSHAKSGNVNLQVANMLQAVGTISLNTETMPSTAGPFSLTVSNGNSGNIDVIAQHIALDKGATISVTSLGTGQGGDIFVQADTIQLNGQEEVTGIPTSISGISMGSAQTSQVEINARQITLENGGVITTNTFYSGQSNELIVNVSDTLTISGVAKMPYKMLDFPEFPYPSNITSASANPATDGGQASNVYVQAKHINLDAGGTIGSMTYGSGNAGNAKVIADTINISGWQDNGILYRSGINNSSTNLESYAGLAGNIDVTANKIIISDGGAINTSAMNAGGGNININAKDMIYLDTQGSITTSVNSGIEDGGNIDISNPHFTVLNQGQITAQADAGHGGNIHIKSEQFITSPNSLISASSNLGLDGEVAIESIDVDMEGFLVVLSDEVIDASNLMKTPCSQRLGENLSSFVVIPSEGAANSPDDLLPGGPLFENNLPVKK
ncbi:filamentous hemagglutinin N-terminal domain-containing protein [Candidatus Halobeggiatoa sp. HSG11]|nr:filamentous hemagglutinin N-terminal domain-containing protein [Candidatus Halobeggiatoa sp. HSG11]